jgi:phage terminase large subunit
VIVDTPRYTPYGGIAAVWKSRAPEILCDGAAGTGKTRGILEKANLAAMKYPRARILLVRKTRASMTQSILQTLEDEVYPRYCPMTLIGPTREFRKFYLYPNGSSLVLGGIDNPDRILSTSYDMVIAHQAEELTENDWEMMLTRLRHTAMPYRQAIAECNPSYPGHWLMSRVRAGKMVRIPTKHSDNPTNTPEYLERLSGLSGHRRARLYDGLWVAAEGQVYPQFESCLCDDYPMPLGTHVGGIDFGFNDAFAALAACVYTGEDKRQHIYVYYERYMSKRLISEHATALPKEPSYRADPSRPDSIIELRRAGVRCAPAMNDILIGVNAVNARIESGTLHISKRCRALVAEAGAYVYPADKSTELPVDEFNHALDALRYLIMGVDKGRVARIQEREEAA